MIRVVEDIIHEKPVRVEKLKTRYSGYASFHVTASLSHVEELMNVNAWDEGTLVRRYYFQRQIQRSIHREFMNPASSEETLVPTDGSLGVPESADGDLVAAGDSTLRTTGIVAEQNSSSSNDAECIITDCVNNSQHVQSDGQ